jgi:hypothetical protein
MPDWIAKYTGDVEFLMMPGEVLRHWRVMVIATTDK